MKDFVKIIQDYQDRPKKSVVLNPVEKTPGKFSEPMTWDQVEKEVWADGLLTSKPRIHIPLSGNIKDF
jgi:hypothetical protein